MRLVAAGLLLLAAPVSAQRVFPGGLELGAARVEEDVVRELQDHAAVANHDGELAGVDLLLEPEGDRAEERGADVALAADGRVKSHISRTGPLSDLDAIFDELEAGKYLGRAVVTDLAG